MYDLQNEEVSRGRLDEVGVDGRVDALPVLDPVADLGLRVALRRVATQLGLATELDLLRVGRRVELFAKI
jgi:hypothetical protein